MDQAMVKRGIGAVVLAIIAALLLGYLLKGKSRDRQEVIDTPVADVTDLVIPDLGGSADAPSANAEANADSISLVGENAINATKNTANNAAAGAKNTVIASADAVTGKARESFNNVTNIVTDIDEPGFSVRPPSQNETREIIDNSASANSASAKNGSANNSSSEGSAAIAYSKDPVNEVIASSKKATKKFKPTIVEEKKKPKKQASKPKKAVKKAVETKKPTTTAKAPASKPAAPTPASKPSAPKAMEATGNTPLGKYSVQLLATSSQSRAGKLANTMKSEGYKVFVTETNSNNKILFRVRVGGHADRDAAVEAQEGMKRRYEKNFFIQNSLVVSN